MWGLLGVLLSAAWLAVAWFWFDREIGLDNYSYVLLPEVAGQFVAGLLAPLILIWVLVAALRCKDKIRTSVTLEVQLSVSPQAEDAARAAERVGAAHVADEARLRALFESRFEVALRSALGQLRFEEAERERELLGETIAQIVGADLDGFRLEGVFVRELEQVPVELHDPNDLLDAEGIRAIVERTAEATVRANELRRAMEAQIAAQNVEAAAALAQIERRRAAQAEEHAAAIEAEKERQRRGW